MKPLFALSLSFEGISLLYRATDGWRAVGDVPLDDDDLPNALADLRHKADQLAGGPWYSKLIIPNDQIRYLTVETGPLKGDARQGLIEAEIAGATPYALSELAFDLSTQGAVTHVAAVAIETLGEAEAFAVEHQFNPVSFVALPDTELFLKEPYFGETQFAAEQDSIGPVQPDDDVVSVIGMARVVPVVATPDPVTTSEDPEPKSSESLSDTERTEENKPKSPETPQTDDDNAPATASDVSAPKPAPETPPEPAPGFSSRRRKTASGAPVLDGASRSAPAAPAAPLVPAPESGQNKKPVSVASPVLDLPPEPEKTVAADQTTSAPSKSGFLSRRKPPADKPDVEQPDAPQPVPFKAAVQDPDPPVDETERMTVFGARDSQKVRGKPRFLGLILTVALLFFLAAVAAWASLFLDDGVTGLFRNTPERTEIALRDQEEETTETPKLAPAPATSPIADTLPPTVPEKAEDAAPVLTTDDQDTLPAVSAAPNLPTLTDTDTAVLDALRQFPTEDEATVPETIAVPETSDSDVPIDTKTDEALYAATGIWPNAPDVPLSPFIIDLDDIYLASIDRTDLSQDAIALPPLANLETDAPINTVASPAAVGTAAVLDSRGLVDPTVDGAVTPDGVLVYLGRPPIVPPPTPTRFETTPDLSDLQQEEYLAALRPRLRPDALVESNERARFGGRTLDELAKVRPKLRPKTEKQIAEEDETPTAQAVAVSPMPKTRPGNFAALVAKAKPKPTQTPTQTASTSTTAAAAASAASTADVASGGITSPGRTGGSNVSNASVKPAAPSPSSVARQATLKNSINLKRLNLIGVYGTPSNRRALIRLPSGRYKKVQVGDLVDGGRVVGIGESELRYQKGSRSLTLKMPSG